MRAPKLGQKGKLEIGKLFRARSLKAPAFCSATEQGIDRTENAG